MKNIILTIILGLALLGCSKGDKSNCYDESLVHDGFCTTDCPGFEACDGKTYCNECEAARLGMGPK